MDALTYCAHCKMAVQTECKEEDYPMCVLFKSAKARKERNYELEALSSKELLEHPDAGDWQKRGVFSSKSDSGTKDDTGKVPLDLLAPEFLIGTAMVLQFGAQKYDAYNWAKGMKWSRVFAALMRHMWKWWGGEKLDPETGLSHLWHAACGLMFLIAYEERGTGDDDRPI